MKTATWRGRFPPWLRKRIPAGGRLGEVRRLLAETGLQTVCSSANCPNLPECFSRGTATFMILGRTCTRSCRFCAVPSSEKGDRQLFSPPNRAVGSAVGTKKVASPLFPLFLEPEAVAEACVRLGLGYVVITSVTRDDLPDGGADHFARTIRAVRGRLPQAVVEVLTPDFQGQESAIETVLEARPDVFNHNVETVPRLYRQVRPQAQYRRSLDVLAYVKRRASADGLRLLTKSGMMVGLGETTEEVRGVMRDLCGVGCDILTIGQYLAPSPGHVPIARFVEPAEFAAWRAEGLEMGFSAVAAGPFVRSSYRAEELAGRVTNHTEFRSTPSYLK